MSRETQRRERRQAAQLGRMSNPENLRGTAYHEAAHAVVSELFEFPVDRVTIVPFARNGENFYGMCFHDLTRDSVLVGPIQAECFIVQCFAGVVVEWKIGTEPLGQMPVSDLVHIDKIRLQMGLTQEETYPCYVQKTRDLVDIPDVWLAIERTAKLLSEKKTISGDEVRSIVRENAAQYIVSKKTQLEMTMELLKLHPAGIPEGFRQLLAKEMAA